MPLLLVLLFIVVPIVELFVIIQVGEAIGVLPTIALLIADSVLGSMLMRSQGRMAWWRFNAALAEGRIPHREVLDGVLVIFGGALLLTPGFVTDILGLVLLLPPTRALVRGVVGRRFLPRIVATGIGGISGAGRRPGDARTRPRPADGGDVEGTATEGDPPPPRRRRRGPPAGGHPAPAVVTVTPADDAPRPPAGDGFSDAVTVAFGDERADLYGIARLGLAEGGASGLAILFHRGEPVAVRAEGGIEADAPRTWDEVSAAGLDTEVVEPLHAWRLRHAAEAGSLDLELGAVGAVAELDPASPVAELGGMAGFEQALRVTGAATVRGQRIAGDALGQRGRSWVTPDWGRMALARTVGAWLGDGLVVSLSAIRPAGERDHEHEQ